MQLDSSHWDSGNYIVSCSPVTISRGTHSFPALEINEMLVSYVGAAEISSFCDRTGSQSDFVDNMLSFRKKSHSRENIFVKVDQLSGKFYHIIYHMLLLDEASVTAEFF